MDIIQALLIGIGLSAACGFRVFVPLLVMSIAAHSGHLQLAPSLEWAGSWPAMLAFGTATALEIGGYYIPWLDNLLDSIATPAAFIAGTLATAAATGQVLHVDPLWQWSIAAIVGGGSATVVQGATVVVRAASSLATGGLGNPVVSTTEAGTSTVLSLLAVILPLVAGLLLLLMAVLAVSWIIRRHRRMAEALRPAKTAPAAPMTTG